MSYTFDRAVPGNMTGRTLDEFGGSTYIVITYQNFPGRPDDGFLLTVNRNGQEYVTFAYSSSVDGERVLVWDGEHFTVPEGNPGSAYDAFMAGLASLMGRLTA